MSFIAERFGGALDRLRTYDRPLIIITASLIGLGILFSMAASPAATARIRIEEAFYFAGRQAAYAALGVVVMLAAAALDPRQLRRAATIIAGVMLPLCALAAWIGPEVKGAQRWFDFGFFSFQPSELLKPALVVVWAWMLSESMKQERCPGRAGSLHSTPGARAGGSRPAASASVGPRVWRRAWPAASGGRRSSSR